MLQLVVTLALLSAVSWGIGDFLGGFSAKNSHVTIIVFLAHLIGLAILIPFYVISDEENLSSKEAGFASIAGLSGVIGLYILYLGLSQGRMSYIAPISGVTAMIIPVFAGFLDHGFLNSSKYLGILLSILSIWGLTKGDVGKLTKKDLSYALTSGLGFGFFLVFISRASGSTILLPMIVARTSSLLAMFMILLYRKTRETYFEFIGFKPLVWILLAGAFDMAANLLYIKASQVGAIEIAAVLSSMYPATTIILSWAILKEKIPSNKFIYLGGIFLAIIVIAY